MIGDAISHAARVGAATFRSGLAMQSLSGRPLRARARSSALAGLALLAACQPPSTQQGSVSASEISSEQFRQRAFVLRSRLKEQQRVDDVGYPLLRAATAMCGPDATTTGEGLRFATLESFSKDYKPAARALGFSDTVMVVGVAKGSAGDRAGIVVGDRLVTVGNDPAPVGTNALVFLNDELHRARNSDAPLTLAVRHAGLRSIDALGDSSSVAQSSGPADSAALTRRDSSAAAVVSMTVGADTLCNYQLVAGTSDALNAWADGENVFVTSAMLRFTNDDELGVVLAHEIAHDAMKHIQAKKKNARWGAVFGALLDVAAATQGVNTGGGFSNSMASFAAMKFSQEFELEADYVGLYILARAGRPFAGAPDLWRRMATESPASIKFASSHPTTAERFVRLEKAVAEIQAKQAAGQPLMPETKH